MTDRARYVRRPVAAAMAAALALTVLTVAESGPAAAAACSLTGPTVRSVVSAAGTPRVRNSLTSRRDLARAKVTTLVSRRAGSRSSPRAGSR